MNRHLPQPPLLTLATRITLARLALVPVFILVTLYYIDSTREENPATFWRWGAFVLFVVTCLTDALDGYFARSRKEVPRLGTILDPLADKLLLISGLLLLTGPWGRAFHPHLPIWYVVLVLSRDLMLVTGSLVIHTIIGNAVVLPRWSGKAATFFQMTLIGWVLANGNDLAFLWVLGAATALTGLSAIQYLADGIRQLETPHVHEHPHAPPPSSPAV